MRDRAVRRRYGIVVGLEFALLGAGAAVLAIGGLAKWIPVWICADVGIHFIPLSRVLGEPSLVILGVLLSAVALAALITGLISAVAPQSTTAVLIWRGSADSPIAEPNAICSSCCGNLPLPWLPVWM